MSEKDFLETPSSEVKETKVKEATPKETPVRRYSFLVDDNEEELVAAAEETEAIKTPVFVAPSEEEIQGEQDIEEVVPSVAAKAEPEEAEEKIPVVEAKAEEPEIAETKQEPPVTEAVEETPVTEAEEMKEKDPSYQVHSFITNENVDQDKFATKKKERKRKKLRTYQQRQNLLGYAFMSPWILGFLVFTLFPFVATIYLSFTNVKSTIHGYEIKFIGIDNYITAFVKNSKFTPALVEYIKVIIPYTFIVVVISFIIAYLLNKIIKGKGVLRTIYFLPVIIMSGPVMNQLTAVDSALEEAAKLSGATVVTDYSNIFIMKIIESYSPQLSLALGSVFDQLSLILWFTGIPIVLFINALQKINVSIYEAAKIDSANAWQIMWKITIPMLRSIGLIVTIFTIIQLGMYDTINPVYELIIDATGDTSGGLGFAATYAWIYSLIVLVLILIVFLLFREKKGKRGA